MNTLDNFRFLLPLDINKSDNSEEWRIGGYASTSDEDRQGEEIVQKGLDYSDFVNYGWFNHDHHSDVILGYPDKSKCRIDNKGFYVEGVLLKGVELAKQIWETAVALKKSNAPRHLGFSVEGKVLARNPSGKIVKAKIYNVAITANPVNTNCTFDALCKSFTTDINEVQKAMEAGHGENPVIPESLDKDDVDLDAFSSISDIHDNPKKVEALKQKLSKKPILTKSELITYLQLVKGLSFKDALTLASDYIGKQST